jgi:hypothetical protein
VPVGLLAASCLTARTSLSSSLLSPSSLSRTIYLLVEPARRRARGRGRKKLEEAARGSRTHEDYGRLVVVLLLLVVLLVSLIITTAGYVAVNDSEEAAGRRRGDSDCDSEPMTTSGAVQ